MKLKSWKVFKLFWPLCCKNFGAKRNFHDQNDENLKFMKAHLDLVHELIVTELWLGRRALCIGWSHRCRLLIDLKSTLGLIKIILLAGYQMIFQVDNTVVVVVCIIIVVVESTRGLLLIPLMKIVYLLHHRLEIVAGWTARWPKIRIHFKTLLMNVQWHLIVEATRTKFSFNCLQSFLLS